MRITNPVAIYVLLAVAMQAQAQSSAFTPLPSLGGNFSIAYDINNAGQVTGSSSLPNGGQHNVVWTATTTTDLGAFGNGFGGGLPINDAGQVAGIVQNGPTGTVALWNDGAVTALGPTIGYADATNAINASGQVVGAAYMQPNRSTSVALLWSATTGATVLPGLGGNSNAANGINDAGQIIGQSAAQNNLATYATLWNGPTAPATALGTLGGNFGAAHDINNLGQIVGQSLTAGGSYYATLWTDNAAINLGSLGVGSNALAINDSGQAVGYSWLAGAGQSLATLWQDGQIFDINSFLSAAEALAGWVLEAATGINASGWIAGYASNPLLGVNSGAFMMSLPSIPGLCR